MKTQPKPHKPLFVTHDAIPDPTRFNFPHAKSCVMLDIGWISLTVGQDGKGAPLVIAKASDRHFQLSASTLPGAAVAAVPLPKKKKRPDWAYAVDGVPVDFYPQARGLNSLEYAGFRVTHGIDKEDRVFLVLRVPDFELTLLFRDPTSVSSHAWNPLRAIVLPQAAWVGPLELAINLEHRFYPRAIDAELDELLRGFDDPLPWEEQRTVH